LRTYWALIAAITMLTVFGALVTLSLRPVHYVSTADVVVRPESIGGTTPLAPDMGTERQIAESGDVAALAAARLGLSPKQASAGLSVSVLIDTTVLRIGYTAGTADEAYRRVRVFARAYVAYRTAESDQSPPSAGRNHPSVTRPAVVAIISRPSRPSAPARPNYVLVLGLGLLVGAALGAGLAFVWDRLSGRIRSTSDLEAHTGLPVLTSIPTLGARIPHAVAVTAHETIPGAEAYGFLAARTAHELDARKASTLVVTSPTEADGKTSVAVNLACGLAALGKRTVLVSMDGRSPAAHECFGLDPRPGLVQVARGASPLTRAVHETTVPGLRVLTAGTEPPTKAVLTIAELSVLVESLRLSSDIVVFDGLPLLRTPQTLIVAENVDLVILVVDARGGTRADAATAASLLESVSGSVIGVVANHPPARIPWTARRGVALRRGRTRSGMTALEERASEPVQSPRGG
jgi:capsular exopolysaccharide synthesis family protein